MKKTQPKRFQVSVDKLNAEMRILAYTDFDKTYRLMAEEACHFIRHNFKGTSVKINRGERSLNLQAEDLKPGDTVLKIYNFPDSLKKITEVKPALISELKRRGMVEFIVEKKVEVSEESKKTLKKVIDRVENGTTTPEKKKRRSKKLNERAESVEQVNHIAQKVKEAVRLKHEASQSIESSMDKARNGKVTIGKLQENVNAILSESSAEAMSAVMNLKESDQTYDHCIDVGALFETVYGKIVETKGIPCAFKLKSQPMLAGFLHDFGKSKIPKDVLESTARYGIHSQEMKLLRSHPLYGAVLLSDLDMPSAAINMTHFHHVKQDIDMPNSYPEGVQWSDVSYETRLLSILDVYQALTGRRKYKRSWSAPSTMRYLDALAGIEYDLEVWEDFLAALGIYPMGSLVQLNDGSLGFVMSIPENGKDLERPLVAVVRNSDGEDLKHQHLVDLEKERDMSIVKDLDYKSVFGDRAFDIFTSIQVS